jgi:hypothetical protein
VAGDAAASGDGDVVFHDAQGRETERIEIEAPG